MQTGTSYDVGYNNGGTANSAQAMKVPTLGSALEEAGKLAAELREVTRQAADSLSGQQPSEVSGLKAGDSVNTTLGSIYEITQTLRDALDNARRIARTIG